MFKANASNLVRVLLIPGREIQTQRDSQPMRMRDGLLAVVVSPDARGLRMLFPTMGGAMTWSLNNILPVIVLFLLESSAEKYFCFFSIRLDTKLKPYTSNCSHNPWEGGWPGLYELGTIGGNASWTC